VPWPVEPEQESISPELQQPAAQPIGDGEEFVERCPKLLGQDLRSDPPLLRQLLGESGEPGDVDEGDRPIEVPGPACGIVREPF